MIFYTTIYNVVWNDRTGGRKWTKATAVVTTVAVVMTNGPHLQSIGTCRGAVRIGLCLVHIVEQNTNVQSKLGQVEDGQRGREEFVIDVGGQGLVKDPEYAIDGHGDQQDQINGEERGLESSVLDQGSILALSHALESREQLDIEDGLTQDVVEAKDGSSSISESPCNSQVFAAGSLGRGTIAERVLDSVDDDNGEEFDGACSDQDVVQNIDFAEWRIDG